MAQFLAPLTVTELGEDRWMLNTPLPYQSDVLHHTVTVPAGFVTDLESVPRWMPIVYAILYGAAHAAGVVHDFLYTFQFTSRQTADAVLYEAVVATGQPAWKAYVIWLGIRAGGWVAWKGHQHGLEPGS